MNDTIPVKARCLEPDSPFVINMPEEAYSTEHNGGDVAAGVAASAAASNASSGATKGLFTSLYENKLIVVGIIIIVIIIGIAAYWYNSRSTTESIHSGTPPSAPNIQPSASPGTSPSVQTNDVSKEDLMSIMQAAAQPVQPVQLVQPVQPSTHEQTTPLMPPTEQEMPSPTMQPRPADNIDIPSDDEAHSLLGTDDEE